MQTLATTLLDTIGNTTRLPLRNIGPSNGGRFEGFAPDADTAASLLDKKGNLPEWRSLLKPA